MKETVFTPCRLWLICLLAGIFTNVRGALPDPTDGTVTITVTSAGSLSATYTAEDFAACRAARLKIVGPLSGPDMMLIANAVGDYIKELDLGEAIITDVGKYHTSYYSFDVNMQADVIGKGMFYQKTQLRAIVLPTGLTGIGEGAFFGCSNLTAIEFPSSLQTIGSDAFGYSGLTSITLPNGMTAVPSYICRHCTSLSSVTLPSSVTQIGSGAFEDCSSLTSISIPAGVTVIEGSAFRNTGLTSINLPTGLTKIEGLTFQGCPLTMVTVHEGVTEIGDRAFSSCLQLKAIYLPSTINKVYLNFVTGSNLLKEVHIKATTCPTTIDAYPFSVPSATLYVPSGSLEAYTGTDFASIFNHTVVEEAVTLEGLSEGEWNVLRQLPGKTNGDNWTHKWTFGATAAETAVPQGVTVLKGHVVSISLVGNNLQGAVPSELLTDLPALESLDLSHNQLSGTLASIYNKEESNNALKYLDLSYNQLTGNVHDLTAKLSALTTLKLGYNRIGYVYPMLSTTISSIDLGGQDLSDLIVGMKYSELFNLKGNAREVLPSVLTYRHTSTPEYQTSLSLAIGDQMAATTWKMNFEWRSQQELISSASEYTGINNTYRLPVNSTVYAWTVQPHFTIYNEGCFFPLIMDFESGDVNFDAKLNLSDMQQLLNFAFDPLGKNGTFFNFTAGDMIADGAINVQDVVACINALLQKAYVPTLWSRIATPASPNNPMTSSPDAQATLTVENGRLVLRSSVDIAAIEVTLSDDEPQWQPALNLFSRMSQGGHTIFYSLFGDQLPAGETVMALTKSDILNAMMVDIDGREIPLAIGANTTGIRSLDDGSLSSKGSCYDLSGRRLSSKNGQLKKGVYIKDGKKVIEK